MIPMGFLPIKEFIQVAFLLTALSVLSAAKSVLVPENYDGQFPWFLTKIEANATGEFGFRLVDDYNGTFGIESQMFLFSLRSFDREEQDTYELKINVEDPEGRQVDGPLSVTLIVTDMNDNAPEFEQDPFSGTVYKGAHAGYRILKLAAIDLDDPLTPNAKLFYQIISQHPEQPSDMFQVNELTGDITLTAEGSAALDVHAADQYKLVVQVKDMGELNQGNYVKAHVIITVTENVWVSLSPVLVHENQEGPYPLLLSKVQWNSPEVRYKLQTSSHFHEGLFTIDKEGQIQLMEPLDYEYGSEYYLEISALDYNGDPYAEPLELIVRVVDENDNEPRCSPELYLTMVQEHEQKGSCIVELRAEDRDDPLTENGHLFFRLHRQEPQGPEEPLFTVDSDGVITLARDMRDYHSLNYQLFVHVADLGGAEGGLSSTCTVIIHVDELNDHAPEFTQEQYGPISVPEDAVVGHVITSINASDADLYMSNSWLVTYLFQSGNEDQTFGIIQDEWNNTGKLTLRKALDFEAVSEYIMVVSARNSEQLEGVNYGASSTATFFIHVEDVNERPELRQEVYVVNVSRDSRPGSLLLKLEGRDPDTPPTSVRYRLNNESQHWLSIGAESGEVTFLGRGPAGSPHLMDVRVEDGDDPSLFVMAHLVIHIEEFEETPGPLLVSSGNFLCTPRREEQVIAITVSHRAMPMILSVEGQPMEQRKWRIDQVNDTLALLSIALSWMEPGLYQVVIALSERGDETVRHRDTLPVTICTCSSQGQCQIDLEPVQGKPTILTTVSTFVGTFTVIGLSLVIILVRLSMTGKLGKKRQRDTSMESTSLRFSA
ncbi:cadherin-16 isoform X2 [Narcine bancroftii]